MGQIVIEWSQTMEQITIEYGSQGSLLTSPANYSFYICLEFFFLHFFIDFIESIIDLVESIYENDLEQFE